MPSWLVPHLGGQRFFRRTLRTSDVRLAKRRAFALWDSLQMKLQILQDLLADPALANVFNPLYLKAILKEADYRDIGQRRHPFIESYLSRLGVPDTISRDDALAFTLLAAEERQALLEKGGEVAAKVRLAELRLEAKVPLRVEPQAVVAPAPPMLLAYQPLSFADAAERFMRDKEQLSYNGKRNYRTGMARLGKFLSDQGLQDDLAKVTREHLIAYRVALSSACAASSIGTYLTQVTTFFSWLADTQRPHLPPHWSSPAVRIRESVGYQQRADKQEKRPDEEAERFTDDELRLILRQCGRAIKGEVRLGGRSRYADSSKAKAWVLLVMAYTGLRPTEAGQIHVDQLAYDEQAGCYMLDVTPRQDGQRVKNKSARRIVPLLFPADLQTLFAQYIADETSAAGFIFPWRVAEDGRLDAQCRQALSDVLALEGVESGGRLTPYAFRHTISDRCKQLGLDVSLTKDLVGHADSDITTGRYGKRSSPQRLAGALRDASVFDFDVSSQ